MTGTKSKRPTSNAPSSMPKPIFGAVLASVFASAAGSVLAATDAPNYDAAENTVTIVGQKINDAPYADPKAPYRAVKSAQALLPETLMDTPKSIQVLTKEYLDDLGTDTFRDVIKMQPGITLGTGEGGNAYGDRIFIRGFDARNDVYIDGLRDPGVGSREVFGVEQIEILKGPSSSFGGRGTTGGVVSLTAKKPLGKSFQEIEVSVGTDNLARLTYDGEAKLTQNTRARLNLMAHDGNIAGRDRVYNRRYGAALATETQINDKWRISTDLYHVNIDYMPDWGVPYDVTLNAPAKIKRSNFYGVVGRDFGKNWSDIATLSTQYQFNSNLRLEVTARAGRTLNAYLVSAPGGGITTLTSTLKSAANTVTTANVGDLVTRISAPSRDQLTSYLTTNAHIVFDAPLFGKKQTFIFGVESSREKTKMVGYAFLECGSGTCVTLGGSTVPVVYQNLFNPNPDTPWTADARTPSSRTQIYTATSAIYALESIHLSDNLIFQAGARQDRYTTRRTVYTNSTQTTSDPVTSGSRFFSYHLGLTYKPVDQISLYAQQGTSQNPPCEVLDSTGIDYGGCSTTSATTQPISNRSSEIGTKILLGDHFELNAALFHIDRRHAPIVVSNVLYTENQAVKGVEIAVSGNITPKLAVFGGIAVLETEILSSTYQASTNVGRAFPNIPKFSASLSAKYQLSDVLSLGATAIHQSERFGGTVVALDTKLPAFDRFDLMAEYRIKKNLDLRLNIQNAGDTTYYDALYRSASPFVYIAAGRSVMLTLDWEF